MPKVTEKPKSATSSPSASTTTSPSSQQTPKLRSACDACHEAKVRCTGGNPCLHCKNHRLDCHYSYAARIGKPKGSRNRKTLARLREAGLLIGINNGGITSPTPSLGSSSPVSPSTADSAPSAWSKSDPLGYQTDSIPYGWTSTFTLPTPPDTGDYTAGCLNFQQDNITSHPATTAGSLVDPAAFHTCDPVWSQDTSLFTVSSGSTIHQQQTGGCSCFEWQTTKLVSLHTLSRTTPDSPDPTWPDHHNSGLSAACDVLLSCRKTLLCNYCDKDAAKVLLTVAAIQLALRRIEAAFLHTVKMRNMRILSSSSTASADSMAPEDCRLRHAISQAQDVVNDLRHVVVAQNVSVLSSPGAGYGMTVVEFSQPSANDTSYLHVTVSRLQTTIDRFNAMLG